MHSCKTHIDHFRMVHIRFVRLTIADFVKFSR
jgi:hypothetical protein